MFQFLPSSSDVIMCLVLAVFYPFAPVVVVVVSTRGARRKDKATPLSQRSEKRRKNVETNKWSWISGRTYHTFYTAVLTKSLSVRRVKTFPTLVPNTFSHQKGCTTL